MGCLMWCLGLVLGLSLKNLPFMWHFRFFGALAMGYLARRRSSYALQQYHVFLPAVVRSRSPATEGDFNIHKSNSTYITDLDISRAHLSGFLFAPILLSIKSSVHCNLIVSAISCTFHQEIKPFRPYEIWTRVASWDDKWIYMVTHFVDTSEFWPSYYIVKAHTSTSRNMRVPVPHRKGQHVVFASAVTRMVFKSGRLTVPPKRALEICGPLSAAAAESRTAAPRLDPGDGVTESVTGLNEWTVEEMASYNETNLPIVRLERGWDAVRGLFREDQFVLAEYSDFMW
ncbi:hypothetical protein AtubIFM61612_007304 [Aspergillus tubingensis]|nr:hypothetical protein AtubIFM61612_007304 [Aspergillus tubingensis]